ncbi:MAG TPA: DUF1326 domain-containing protein [Ktedonobacterales bacterium]|nr:DUF1326 domain-containing protein [Ktedonobacterales bacterium]
MTAPAKTLWRIKGICLASCNCAWACPCQFNELPTHGNCVTAGAYEIRSGHYGDTPLYGLRCVEVYHWPGPIHEGNGTRLLVIDERATPAQRAALAALFSGEQGGAYFEILASVTPNRLPTIHAPIEFEMDRAARRGTFSVAGVTESQIAPITNPVTGAEHTIRIVLPNGFEFKEADIANSVRWSATLTDQMTFTYERSYAQLNDFEWSNT